MWPETAAAATDAGDARCVRLCGPCRCSKLRLVVEIARLPGATTSPLLVTHIEQPAWRHSQPAAPTPLPGPPASAAAFTCIEPGTTSAVTPAATLRPRTTRAAASRSERRLFVHEPMKA